MWPQGLWFHHWFCCLTKCREDFLEFVVRVVFTKVFDVDIGELHGFGAKLNFSFFPGLKVAHKTANRHKPTTDRTGGRIKLDALKESALYSPGKYLWRYNVRRRVTSSHLTEQN